MSAKKQSTSIWKLCSFYKETSEEFLDETDVDSFFHQYVFDISQSRFGKARVSWSSNKKSFAIKLFHFCHIKTQQRYILQKVVDISKRKLTSLVDSLRDFLKVFDHASKCIQVSLPKPKVENGSTKLIDNLLLNTVTISLKIRIDKLVYVSNLETTMFASFPRKSSNTRQTINT